uniref:Uncharacterized protein n=1 Tax=Timema cristinae TaxID=61476 RepID=A0A7R9DT17_TIMCR|nr:unnamed protein product [Timema cristinae]
MMSPWRLCEAAQPLGPNSLDQLLQFTEDGICRADGYWSMDYWDPYGLDEGLLGSVATGVPTSTQLEAPPTGLCQTRRLWRPQTSPRHPLAGVPIWRRKCAPRCLE